MEKKNINEVIANLSVEQLAGMIDHTFLKPFGTAENIEKLCAEARQYKFAMVAINPAEVETCVKLLEGSGVRVGAAIGFPLGQNTVECKAFETRDAIAKGATEIDTVINVRALQKGQTDIVKKEIEDMVSICKPAGVICKVILETCYLTDEEKETVCRIAKEAGVDFVKTSTGFGRSGDRCESCGRYPRPRYGTGIDSGGCYPHRYFKRYSDCRSLQRVEERSVISGSER